MLVSLSWMKDYVGVPADTEMLAERLTLAGHEVERIVRQSGSYEGVIVAEVTGLRPLPGSTKNQVATISTGKGGAEVVTGAWNLQAGDRVPYAAPGARLGSREIGKKTFLGVASEGMLCSPIELGLGDDATGIMILDRAAAPGADLKTLYPPDTILGLDLKSNRPDLLCHTGVAREVGAIFKLPLHLPDATPEIKLAASPGLVTIDAPEGCRRFVGRLLTSVRVGPSPTWLQARLRAVGVRPINNVVDVTNYVMLELGQPMHAFDHALLEGGRLVVRRAKAGEPLLTLDGKERRLSEDVMVVADARKAQALAGIIGGEESAVTNKTTTVVLEAATWEPRRIRRSSRLLGLRTEASSRFERGLSPALSLPAVNRAARLVRELAGGKEEQAADVYPSPLMPVAIDLAAHTLEHTLGLRVPMQDAKDILKRLAFTVTGSDERLRVTPPDFRLDCTIPADVVEEVGRIYGYDRVPSTLPGERTPVRDLYEAASAVDVARDVLVGCGFDEAVTNSLVSHESAATIHLPEAPAAAVKIRNPLSETRDGLRLSLLPGLLEAVSLNVRQDQPGVRLFELGSAFWPVDQPTEFPAEPRLLSLVLHVPSSSAAAAALELRRLQATLLVLGQRVGKAPVDFRPAQSEGFHPGRTAQLHQGRVVVGVAGEVHPIVLAAFDLPGRAIAAELVFDRFADADPPVPQARALPRFPGIRRDLTIVVHGRIQGNDLVQVIRQLGGYTLREVSMQSEYEGPQLGAGRRSLSFGLQYQADDRTLTHEEVSELHARIVQGLKERFGAEVRS